VSSVRRLDPTTYGRHLLPHGKLRMGGEELLRRHLDRGHSRPRLEPRAILPFTVAIDFEGDQWTFFKPPHDELRELYGLDVQEMNVWRPLLEHALEHLGAAD